MLRQGMFEKCGQGLCMYNVLRADSSYEFLHTLYDLSADEEKGNNVGSEKIAPHFYFEK